MKYKVLDSSGLAFNRDFTGLELEYVGDQSFYGVILRQPKIDNNSNECNGLVIMDKKSVELIKP